MFQFANATAECGLPKQQRIGRASKAAVIHCCHSVSKMLQIDGRCSVGEGGMFRLEDIILHCSPPLFSYLCRTSFKPAPINSILAQRYRKRSESKYRSATLAFMCRVALSTGIYFLIGISRGHNRNHERFMTIVTGARIGVPSAATVVHDRPVSAIASCDEF